MAVHGRIAAPSLTRYTPDMDTEPDNLTLRYLRRIDEKLDRVADDVTDLKGRVSALETGLNGIRRDLVALSESDARLQVAIDRQGDRLERIERRLDIASV